MTTGNRAKRTIINLSNAPEAPISRLAELTGTENLAETLEETVERFFAILRRAMPPHQPAEWCLILDALQPPWTATEEHVAQLPSEIGDAITMDQLDRKWEVNGQKLKTRMDHMPYASRMAMGFVAEVFWKCEPGTSYPSLMEKVTRLMGTHQPAPLKTERPTRLSKATMGLTEREEDEVAQETPGETPTDDGLEATSPGDATAHDGEEAMAREAVTPLFGTQ